MTGNLYSGLLEFEEMMFVIHYLRTEDIFFDIGANVGIYTLLAAYIKKARVHCFEPVPSTFYFLKMNIAANNLENRVSCYNNGVGNIAGKMTFAADLDAMNKVITGSYKGKVIEAEIVQPDTNFRGYITSNTMLKIDTEGFELNVLQGADKLLSDPLVKVILIEMNESEKIHELLTAKGFTACSYDPRTREVAITDHHAKANIIYVKDILFVRERVLSAEKFAIRGYEF